MNDFVIMGIVFLMTLATGAWLELCDRLGR